MIKHEKLCHNKKVITSVFEILAMDFCFVSPCCFLKIYKNCPKVMLLLIMALKRAVILGWEGQLDEVKLILSWC